MILRPRQEKFVRRCVKALGQKGNTLGVAPTGAGKTVMMSAIIKEYNPRKVLVIQHRGELVTQNMRTFHDVAPAMGMGIVNADRKDWSKPVTFAMIQTLARNGNIDNMPPQELVVVDEAHHTAAPTYRRILNRAREIESATAVLGVTATPARSDGKGFRGIFDNVGDQISLSELILSGHLVRPRTFVIDLGVHEALRGVRRTASDFDPNEVARILDHQVLNEQVVKHWKEKAGDRRTVVFCSTVEHAQHVMDAFNSQGIATGWVHGDLSSRERAAGLKAFEAGDIQVLVNVAVLTEGWDCPPCSCVVLTRQSSHQSVMAQMIGRGLRVLDPEKYPGQVKADCVVLDFGISALLHGTLEADAKGCLGRAESAGKEEGKTKECPGCSMMLPIPTRNCPICGHEFLSRAEKEERMALEALELTEIDLLSQSPFRYEALFDGKVLAATAFEAWAMVVDYRGTWAAVGGGKEVGIHCLAVGDKKVCIALADDFMRQHGDKSGARKTKSWLQLPATPAQLQHLGLNQFHYGISRYQAACQLSWQFNERGIRKVIEKSARTQAAT